MAFVGSDLNGTVSDLQVTPAPNGSFAISFKFTPPPTQTHQTSVSRRLVPYSPTYESEIMENAKLQSISAMPAYNKKSHEELRWKDYKKKSDKSTFTFPRIPPSQASPGLFEQSLLFARKPDPQCQTSPGLFQQSSLFAKKPDPQCQYCLSQKHQTVPTQPSSSIFAKTVDNQGSNAQMNPFSALGQVSGPYFQASNSGQNTSPSPFSSRPSSRPSASNLGQNTSPSPFSFL